MSTVLKPASHRSGNRLRPLVWGGAAGLLLLPAVAMRLGVPGVHWTGSDFAVMGLMLAAACGLYELATRRSASTAYRAGFALAVATAFLTVWTNLAVGVFGREDDRLNLMFGAVLLVAVVGALLARLRARGMVRAMAATAAAQLLAALVGLGVGLASAAHVSDASPLLREVLLVAAFALPWAGSALLFHRAGDAGRHLLPRG